MTVIPLGTARTARLLMKEATDRELVGHALRGDRSAEEGLYRRHVDRVTTVVARLLRHGPDVEDVVQDAFIEAFRGLGRLREPDHFDRWVYRIAVHRAHSRLRRQRLLSWLGFSEDLRETLATQVVGDAPQEARMALADLDRALDQLPPEERTCWVLRHLEGHRLDEVAELTRCSLATAKRRLARAAAVIDAHLEEDEA